jgi:hypothetical protein
MDFYQNVAEHGNAAFKQGRTLSGFRGFSIAAATSGGCLQQTL